MIVLDVNLEDEMKKKLMGLKRTVMFVMTLLILLGTTLSFYYMWDKNFSESIIRPFYKNGNILIVMLYAVIVFAFTKIYSGYRIGYLKLSEVIYSQVLSLLFVNIITYIQISLIGRRFLSLIPMIKMTVVQIIIICIWAFLTNKLYFYIYPPRKTLFIFGEEDPNFMINKFNKHKEKFNISSKISINIGVEEVVKKLNDFEAIILYGIDVKSRERILEVCYERSLRVYVVPTPQDVIINNSDTLHLIDTPMLLLRNRGLSAENRFAKRAIDIILSSIALLILSPIMLIVAALIKLYDRGPALFKQKRLTTDGKTFDVYKFRSMIVDAEKDGVARLASKNDNRITPIGKFIRAVRLDELPQLLNILKGDMSIVGPRPERPEIAEEYMKTMPEFKYRLKVKAGLTGYAQILGKYNTTPRDKLLLDMMYIEKYSLFLDFKLMLMTVKILFMSESTEGVEEGNILPNE